MTSSIPGPRELPASRFDLSTYWGRVRHSMDLTDPRSAHSPPPPHLHRLTSPSSTLLVSSSSLSAAKSLIADYKNHRIPSMTPALWSAKKTVDATLHPDTGTPVFLPFRMSAFVLTNLVVTAGMLTPGLSTRGTLAWQITNQSVNVAINYSNANKSAPLSSATLAQSYLLAVSASCGVAIGLNNLVPRLRRLSPAARTLLTRLVPFAAVASAGALNVFLMRGEEIRRGIDVYAGGRGDGEKAESLGKSRAAATMAVGETAASRVFNSTPVMAIPPLILVRLQGQRWLQQRPRLVLPVNLGLILVTSVFALPLALAVFPQREKVEGKKLEKEFWEYGEVEFNRGV